MRLEAIRTIGRGDGPLDRLDARFKLVATLALVVGVVASPLTWWGPVAVAAAILAGLVAISSVSPRALIVRWLGLVSVVGFLALVAARAHPARGQMGYAAVVAAILARNALAIGAVLLLSAVTPFPAILAAMGRLGMPPVLVATLQFMYRYLHVFADELDRMGQARRSRSFGRRGLLGPASLSGLIGMLFLRAFERGDRVHAAMLARGWDGTVRTLDGAGRR